MTDIGISGYRRRLAVEGGRPACGRFAFAPRLEEAASAAFRRTLTAEASIMFLM